MKLNKEALDVGAKAQYEHYLGEARDLEPTWADLRESQRERMRTSFAAGVVAALSGQSEAVATEISTGWKFVPWPASGCSDAQLR